MVRNLIITVLGLFSLLSCKTKKVNAQKAVQISNLQIAKRIDSMVNLNYKLIAQLRLTDVLERSRFAIESVGDSLHYQRKINGKVVEEIKLKGGKLFTENERHKTSVNKTIDANVEINSHVSSTLNKKEKTINKNKEKQKDLKVTGGTFGTYISIVIIIIMLAVLAFLAWRLKLF